MDLKLITSGRRSKKPKKGALVSLLIHGALITAAAAGTAQVAAQPEKPKEEQLVFVEPPPPPPPPPEPKKVYVAPKKAPPKPAVKRAAPPPPRPRAPQPKPAAATPAPAPRAPVNAPVLQVPTTVPVAIPPANLGGIPTVSDVVARAGDERGEPAKASSEGSGDANARGEGESKERVETVDNGGIFNESTVDVEVSPLNGGPSPNYPSRLRSSGVEGVVVASFVVDANGRVEGNSIKILDSPNDGFNDEVKRALRSARFRPAQARGTKVRQLVQQSFVFRLTR